MTVVEKITLKELHEMAQRMYGTLVKGVVDVEKNILVVDAEMHVDEEQYLLEHDSKQANLWGINLLPGKYGTDEFVEFDSMINIRPSANNMSRGVEDLNIRKLILDIVTKKVTDD